VRGGEGLRFRHAFTRFSTAGRQRLVQQLIGSKYKLMDRCAVWVGWIVGDRPSLRAAASLSGTSSLTGFVDAVEERLKWRHHLAGLTPSASIGIDRFETVVQVVEDFESRGTVERAGQINDAQPRP